jgi:hypothetical protein
VRALRCSAPSRASQIGHPCPRSLWYSFRHCSTPVRSGQLGRICETGGWYESRIVGWLKTIGLRVEAPEPQFEYTACSGHFVARLDGAVLGVPGAEKTWHLLECKHSNTKKFARITKGIEKSMPVWYAQVQCCMSLAGLERALVVVADKNETWEQQDIYHERVRHDKAVSAALLARAQRIISATTPPERLSDTAEAFDCARCDHRAVCQGALPRRSCRTCAFVEVAPEGRWLCTVAASMRGLVNECPPETFRSDVQECPRERNCESYLVAPCFDDGAAARAWVEEHGPRS